MQLNQDTIKQWLTRAWTMWTDRDNRWLSVPCTLAALLVLLVMVKSCQGIVYNYSDECKIYKLGYPIEEARLLVATLSNEQADSLIAHQEHDTIAIPVINARYFIADNFDRYLAFHKADTTGAALDDIIALVNVGADQDRETSAVPCDTTKRHLMLVNGRHYLDEHYKPADLTTFNKSCCYEDQRAMRAVVDAFVALQQECKKQTDAHLMVNSAYRSYQDQIGTYRRNDKRYVATPGFSEHQTGFAIDVTSLQHPEKWSFGKSKEGVWMRENCHKYGFILRYPENTVLGFSYEPWHLRYVGKDVATRIHDEGITFDEYYAYYIESPHAKPLSR
jgi:D-alanyl-D-alanine carboxypeptidase